MKRIKMLGLMVVAVFALSAVAASTASALQWLDNGLPITVPILVLSTGTLLLADLASLGGGTSLTCEGDNHGTVGPGALDLTISITPLNCSFEKAGGCKAGTIPTVRAVNLPWHTLLLTVAGVTRDMILPDGNGHPGWLVLCENILGGESHDVCTSLTGDPKITNNATDVTETFEASETASCTQGNATSGMVIGNVLIFAENRATLRISTG